MDLDREELLDELARVYAHAAVDAFLQERDTPPGRTGGASVDVNSGNQLNHAEHTDGAHSGATAPPG
jgi:hypothetical protein